MFPLYTPYELLLENPHISTCNPLGRPLAFGLNTTLQKHTADQSCNTKYNVTHTTVNVERVYVCNQCIMCMSGVGCVGGLWGCVATCPLCRYVGVPGPPVKKPTLHCVHAERLYSFGHGPKFSSQQALATQAIAKRVQHNSIPCTSPAPIRVSALRCTVQRTQP